MKQQQLDPCPECGYPLTDEEISTSTKKRWSEGRTRIEELEALIDKLKSCNNCTHCYNNGDDMYCNKDKEYLDDFSPCDDWEIQE